MQLRIALAGALRALRLKRRLRYEQLSDASVKSKISALERGEAGITLEKFESLAEALDIDPLALFALCMSARRDTPYPVLLESAHENLRAFEADGGMEVLAEQFVDGGLVKRSRGKPTNSDELDAVRKLKTSGMTQAQISKELALSPSTVSDYWKRILTETPEP